MDVADFDYTLPPAAIAQVPVEPRDSARLLVDRGWSVPPDHRLVVDLPELLGPGDVLVVNDTRVLPARLRMRKPTGGAVEVLLLERRTDGRWEALVRPGGRVRPGSVLAIGSGGARLQVGEALGDGRRLVRLMRTGATSRADEPMSATDDLAVLDEHGEVPLPPYIRAPLSDPERYQTVLATHPGSVAAPTAGLHLTHAVLDRCRARGVAIERVDLAVGLGTFSPISTNGVEAHHMHAEQYCVPARTLAACAAADRVVAVGTTVVRALESAVVTGHREGRTELFIRAGHRFRVVDAMMTNFHVPRSSLLVLVDAFVGGRWRSLYDTALCAGYRFLSFGDAMFLERDTR